MWLFLDGSRLISIHAPVKGATPSHCAKRPSLGISIHAPVKGATSSATDTGARGRNFNPRSREGSDRRCSLCFFRCSDFNPRSREGSDDLTKELYGPVYGFQSTLP